MSLITCAGSAVLRGRISLPMRGPWVADLVIDTATLSAGQVTIAADGGISLVGTAMVTGVQLDAVHLTIVGGAGGLARMVSGAYRSAQLRDPLAAILDTAGEKQSSIAEDVLAVALDRWTLGGHTARHAIDELCNAATAALGKEIGWRFLGDGALWIGAETWPAVALRESDSIVDALPSERRTVIGVTTPWLLPGVDLKGVGRIAEVTHWIEPGAIRSWALWT